MSVLLARTLGGWARWGAGKNAGGGQGGAFFISMTPRYWRSIVHTIACNDTQRGAPVQAEDKEALLRKQARQARFKAALLSDKARRLRALAQKGVNNVVEAAGQNA